MQIPETIAEVVSSHLSEIGSIGFGVELRDSTTLLAVDLGRTEVVAFVADEDFETRLRALTVLLDSLREDGLQVDPWSWRDETVADEDWADRYKAFFKTTRVGRRIVVRPAWEHYVQLPDDLVLSIDPGRAFGTGTHPTTRLCLRALERIAWLWTPPHAVLDLGCGSGLLAVAAARLWPRVRVQAVDIDPTAVEVARNTCARNGLVDRIQCLTGSLEVAKGSFDLIVANLDLKTLCELRPELMGRLSHVGRAILSGVLAEDFARVVDAFIEDPRVEPEFSEEEAGWRAVIVRRMGG